MAELFKPEIGTMGGTNVSAYTPQSMDYSGVIAGFGQMFEGIVDKPEAAKAPSESERKMMALRSVSSQMLKIDQIEDPTRKAVAFKNLQKNAIREFPAYVDDLNKFFSEQTGDIYPIVGMSVEDLNRANISEWVTKTPEGKAAATQAMINAGGDQEKAQLSIAEAYHYDSQLQSRLARAKQDSEGNKLLFEVEARPAIQGSVDTYFNEMLSKNNISGVLQIAQQTGQGPSIAVIDAVKRDRAEKLSIITGKINSAGLDPTAIKPETFMAQYDTLITTLENFSTLIDRETKNKTEQEVAGMLKNASTVARAGLLKQIDPAMFTYLMQSDPTLEAEVINTLKSGIGVGAANMTPDVSQSVLSSGTVTDSPTAFAAQYSGLAPQEELVKIFNSKGSWSAAMKTGFDVSNKYNMSGATPENMEATHRALSTMYILSLPEIDRNQEAIKSNNVKKLLSDKMFSIADSMVRDNPTKGKDLYTKINTYSANAANILINNFKVNVAAIKETESDPFLLKMDKNGMIELTVNPEAARLDPTLKKAMGAYRYETKARGGRATERIAVEQLPTETDPVKILSNYVDLLEGDNRDQILDSIEALKVIAMKGKNIPIDVRSNGVDVLEIIRQGIE